MAQFFFKDLRISLLLLALAPVLGWSVNVLREDPLPISYQPVEERMNELIGRIVGHHVDEEVIVPTMNTASLKDIYQDEGVLIIDARYRNDYDSGHIPGSVSLPRYSFGEEFKHLLPTLEKHSDGPTIVYCLNNPCQDSLHVARALVHLGYKNVFHYPGGFEAWQDAGLPTE